MNRAALGWSLSAEEKIEYRFAKISTGLVASPGSMNANLLGQRFEFPQPHAGQANIKRERSP